jgi:hypothetical protein
MGRGFVFNNPNATKTCGCGSSFAVWWWEEETLSVQFH